MLDYGLTWLYTYHKQSINHAITFMAYWHIYGLFMVAITMVFLGKLGDSSEVALWGAQPGTLLCLDVGFLTAVW